MMLLPSSIRIGTTKPKAVILSAIWRICFFEWVLALRALGRSCCPASYCCCLVFPRREFAVAGRRPGRLSLAVAAGFIARWDLAVGGKRSKFRLHFRGAPLDARLRRVPRIPVLAAGWRNECERLRNPPSTYARGNFRRHIPRE